MGRIVSGKVFYYPAFLCRRAGFASDVGRIVAEPPLACCAQGVCLAHHKFFVPDWHPVTLNNFLKVFDCPVPGVYTREFSILFCTSCLRLRRPRHQGCEQRPLLLPVEGASAQVLVPGSCSGY